MKKQSAVGLFFSVFLKAVVVILGVVIVALGIIILMKVIKRDDRVIAPATTVGEGVLTESAKDDQIYETTEATTQAPKPDPTAEPSYYKNILVLNSTNIQGLAGRWCGRLNEAGYANTFASDYNTPQETTRIISKQEGVGTDLLTFFNGASYEVGDLTEGSSTSTANYDIIIIIGTSDSDQ